MTKYRIVEETGNVTNETRFYIEYSGRNIFGKRVWFIHRTYKNGIPKNTEFDNIEDATKWMSYKTETVNIKYHYANGKK